MNYTPDSLLYASPLYKTSARAGVLSTTGKDFSFSYSFVYFNNLPLKLCKCIGVLIALNLRHFGQIRFYRFVVVPFLSFLTFFKVSFKVKVKRTQNRTAELQVITLFPYARNFASRKGDNLSPF